MIVMQCFHGLAVCQTILLHKLIKIYVGVIGFFFVFKTALIHSIVTIIRVWFPNIIHFWQGCVMFGISSIYSYMLQKSAMWLLYVFLLEIPFQGTNCQISKFKMSVVKFLILLAMICWLFLGAYLQLSNCNCNTIRFVSVLIVTWGIIDMGIPILLLHLYLKQLSNLIKKRNKIYIEPSNLNNNNNSIQSQNNNQQRRIKEIQFINLINISRKHTIIVFTSVLSTWILSVMPMIIGVIISVILLIFLKT